MLQKVNSPMFFRDNTLTDLAREYYPVNLVKTAELPPNRNYLIGSFPHGIIGTGLTTNMSINIRPWMQMFPGIRPKVVTLDFYFLIPFLRELRCWGMIPSSKTALLQVLGRSNDSKHPHNSDGFTSNAVGLVVGGAQEALDSKPGQYILTLKERKGFVKIAIQAGSPIVPSFSFGEVDILNQAENGPDSKLRTFQTLFKRIVGFSPVIVSGRGLGQSFGVVPFRKPIVQVIGAPIDVKKMINPDPKYVDEIHQKFIDGVHEIFEKYKFDYLENPECAKLVIN
ncbi:2-acylglycerol O-acyltransferase 2-like isoform X2 [Haematobia irritans]|uniref:2-acylglycerol O-acyltransferase 2-like isoform X2 n=1 Tax=Haematobia irritans TaxID=7368 RepID=UPI003F4F6423